MQPDAFILVCPRCNTAKDCSRVRLYTTRVRSVLCPVCQRTTVSSKWYCPCNIPWTQCDLHRRPGFACGTATAKGRQFATRSRAYRLHKQYLSYRKAVRLGPLGAGDKDIIKPSQNNPNENEYTKRSHPISSRTNSAIKKNKKYQSDMRVTSSTCGDAQAGTRNVIAASFLGHCETSRRYQQHLRDAVFPSPKRRKLISCEDMCNSSLLGPEDLTGLKWAGHDLSLGQDANPSIFPNQRSENPKRAKFNITLHCSGPLEPPCKGRCLKEGWTVLQYCQYCHG